jgi:hypothetical protein
MSFGFNFRPMPLRRSSPAALILIALLAISGRAVGQCTKKVSELPTAPELLGFKLGMTKEQIKSHVPQTEFGRTDDFGVSKTTINPYFDPRIDKTKFEGVRSVSLDLLDQRLTSLWIGYDENFKAKTTEDFVKLITQSLQLTAADWSSWRSRGQQMRCADFQLIVQMVAGAPSLRVLDVAAEETIALRRQAKEEEATAAEAAAANAGAETMEEQTEIIADKKSKTYYIGACRPEKEIAEANKVIFKTTDEAEKAGFKLAKNCQ